MKAEEVNEKESDLTTLGDQIRQCNKIVKSKYHTYYIICINIEIDWSWKLSFHSQILHQYIENLIMLKEWNMWKLFGNANFHIKLPQLGHIK